MASARVLPQKHITKSDFRPGGVIQVIAVENLERVQPALDRLELRRHVGRHGAFRQRHQVGHVLKQQRPAGRLVRLAGGGYPLASAVGQSQRHVNVAEAARPRLRGRFLEEGEERVAGLFGRLGGCGADQLGVGGHLGLEEALMPQDEGKLDRNEIAWFSILDYRV